MVARMFPSLATLQNNRLADCSRQRGMGPCLTTYLDDELRSIAGPADRRPAHRSTSTTSFMGGGRSPRPGRDRLELEARYLAEHVVPGLRRALLDARTNDAPCFPSFSATASWSRSARLFDVSVDWSASLLGS